MQLQMEEAELKSLKIPSSAHRGNLSPSKHSFLPTLQEQTQERTQQLSQRRARTGSSGATRDVEDRQRAPRHEAPQDHQLLADISAATLESIKQDFTTNNGSLSIEQFTKAMLRNIGAPEDTEKRKEKTRSTVSFLQENDRRESSSSLGSAAGTRPQGVTTFAGGGAIDVPSSRTEYAAQVVDLFQRVDVHDEGIITWEEVSNYLIEQGMVGRDEFTVDNIKTYEPSATIDIYKHESVVEKLVYLEPMDSIACFSRDSSSFRLYSPRRLVKTDVHGHRGTVINCCFVDPLNQIATCSADMTICLWDAASASLRSRNSTKDVQLCLQWDTNSDTLFSGSIDGTLSCWDLKDPGLKDAKRNPQKTTINDLLMVPDINLLAAAQKDGLIWMWDIATMKQVKKFGGHKKGTFSLAYSVEYQCLLTAGLDQEALVWNPYVETRPIFRLKGHNHALAGVSVVPGTPQILTADVKGTFRLWDMRNFRCVQSFGGNDTKHEKNDLNTFCTIPPHKRVAAGSLRLKLFDYTADSGGESVTDPGGVRDALYNPRSGAFYTISNQSIKTWSAATGQLYKVLRDVASHEITAACLAENGRKVYLGDAQGRVTSHGLNNGALLAEFDRHRSDISCLTILKGTNRLISSSWDGTVKVHTDECSQPPQMKMEFQHHKDGVTCLSCCPQLQLLASGGTDMQVILYDIRTLKHEHVFQRFNNIIAGLDFLPLRCLLVVADQGGLVSLWRVRPHRDKWTLIHHFRNLPTPTAPPGSEMLSMPSQPVPVCAVRFMSVAPPANATSKAEAKEALPKSSGGPRANDEPPFLYTADAKGVLRCWDLSVLFDKRQIVAEDLKLLFERQRSGQLAAAKSLNNRRTSSTDVSPHAGRFTTPTPPALMASGYPNGSATGLAGQSAFLTGLDVTADEESELGRDKGVASTLSAYQVEAPLVQAIAEADGHDESVISMYATEEPAALITCGMDRRVQAWNWKLERLGVLLQSRDRQFGFPYDPLEARQQRLEEAARLVRRLGHIEPRQTRLPKLANEPHSSSAGAMLTVLDLDHGGSRRRKPKMDRDAAWKAEAEKMISDPNATEEDYHKFFEKMQNHSRGASLEPAMSLVPERLVRHAYTKHVAPHIRQRSAGLTKDEAAAADRLARAMEALGGDDYGFYSTMARSLQPGRKSPLQGFQQ